VYAGQGFLKLLFSAASYDRGHRGTKYDPREDSPKSVSIAADIVHVDMDSF